MKTIKIGAITIDLDRLIECVKEEGYTVTKKHQAYQAWRPEIGKYYECLNDKGDVQAVEWYCSGADLRRLAYGVGHWSELHESFEVDDIACSKCEATFNIRKLEW